MNNWRIPWLCTCMSERVLAYNINTLEYPMPTWPFVTKERSISPTMPTDVTWWWAYVTNVRWRIGKFLGCVPVCQKECWHTIPIPLSIICRHDHWFPNEDQLVQRCLAMLPNKWLMWPMLDEELANSLALYVKKSVSNSFLFHLLLIFLVTDRHIDNQLNLSTLGNFNFRLPYWIPQA